MSASSFRIIIVGGGLGGLILANCLQHAGIDYLVLEGRGEIGLHVGAGVGLESNGNRILDQLGIYEVLQKRGLVVPQTHFVFRDPQGRFKRENDNPTLLYARTGYPSWACHRRQMLDVFYECLWNKERVLFDKKVVRFEHDSDCSKVICRDGTEYHGHLIVGNDGVHSLVRREMMRLKEIENPDRKAKEEKDLLKSKFCGLYGVSSAVNGIEPGKFTLVLDKGQSLYWMTGRDGLLGWCLIEPLDQTFRHPNIPRFTEKDAVEFAEKHLDKPVVCDDATDVRFRDIWEKRVTYALVAVETGFVDDWCAGRIVCIGDSVHKMCPESGQGANQAMESAAALTNHLKRLVSNSGEKVPSLEDIRKCLAAFEAHRSGRAKVVVEQTNAHAYVFTYANRFLEFMMKYVGPILGDFQADMPSDRFIGAELLEFLPVPKLSVEGTMPFNPTQGILHYESRRRRALFALPILVVGVLFNWMVKSKWASRTFAINDHSPSSGLSNGGTWTALNATMIAGQGYEALRMPVAEYYLFDPSIFTNIMPIYLLWMLEASRLANWLKPIQLILFFGIFGAIKGFVLSTSIWFFLHYVQSPIEIFNALDRRLITPRYARTILPSLLFAYLIPIFTPIFLPPSELSYTQKVTSHPLWFPIATSTALYLISRLLLDNSKHDRLSNIKADLPSIQLACGVIGLTSAAASLYIRCQHLSFYTTVSSTWTCPRISSMLLGSADPKTVAIFASAALWMGLLFQDLKSARMLEASWARLVEYGLLSCTLVGPGASLVAAWLWREEIVLTRRHWAAVTQAG